VTFSQILCFVCGEVKIDGKTIIKTHVKQRKDYVSESY